MLKGVMTKARGKVVLEVRGGYVERFLNLCTASGIGFWRVRRTEPDLVQLSLKLADYKAACKIGRKTASHIHIIEKVGLPFWRGKALKRLGIPVGIALCCIGIYAAYSCLWTFDVVSDGSFTQSQVMEIAGQYGIKPGVRRADIDIISIRSDLMTERNDISFFALNTQGSHGEIVVRGKAAEPNMLDDKTPTSIVADKSGVVTRMVARSGAPMVQVGQPVVPGDLLISGNILGNTGLGYQVPSFGQVTLETEHKKTLALPKNFYGKAYTGRQTKRYTLCIGNVGVKLYLLEKSPYIWYDKKYEKRHIKLYQDIRLPISLVEECYVELELEEMELLENSVTITDAATDWLNTGYQPQGIIAESYATKASGGFYFVDYKARCLENAGVTVVIQTETEG